MTPLSGVVSGLVADAFESAGLARDYGSTLPSNRPDLGQFQCNGAMAAAKKAGRNPRDLAAELVEKLEKQPIFSQVSIAGPGFINISLTDDFIAKHLAGLADDPRCGMPGPSEAMRVILDYGGPNVAKPMHVGHLRATIIGDCLRRIADFVGHDTKSDVHLGDWGLPMGMLINELELTRADLPYFDPASSGPYPSESPVTLEDLEALYPKAAAACKADPARLEAARQATAELQAGRPGYRALWQHFVDISIASMRREFDALGVHFDLYKGEADVHDLIEPMIADFKAKGIAEESSGALIVRVALPGDKKEIPPLILLKSDGSVMYGTTDLATIVDRVQSFHPELSLYIVDQRQHLHFEQVFRAAKLSGIDEAGALEHIGFGTMNGPDGKPFKTRAGGVMRLHDLIEMAHGQALTRLSEAGLAKDFDEEEKNVIARKVGIAAIKFADLSNERLTNYIFDLERFTQFEGRTGPYLQYTAVRIKSLLAKAEERGEHPGALLPPVDEERDLELLLAGFPDTVALAWGKREPHHLCDYAFRLAQAFSRFYQSCHILSDPNAELRASRLALAALTHRVLSQLLDLLGIEVPARM